MNFWSVPPNSTSASIYCGVVGLEEGVEELGDGYGPVGFEAVGEVLPGKDLGYGKAAGERDDLGEGELAEPVALPSDLGAILVDDFEELLHVGACVLLDLLGGEHLAGGGLAAGVADLGRPVADDEDDPVTEILELAQLSQAHGVSEVDVSAAGVEAHLEAEGSARIQKLFELLLADDFGDAAVQIDSEYSWLGIQQIFLRREPYGPCFTSLIHLVNQFRDAGEAHVAAD